MAGGPREIGEVGDIAEIGEGARDAHRELAIPGGDHQVGVAQHVGKGGAVVDWPALAEGRCLVELVHALEIEDAAATVGDRAGHGQCPPLNSLAISLGSTLPKPPEASITVPLSACAAGVPARVQTSAVSRVSKTFSPAALAPATPASSWLISAERVQAMLTP